jgi:hypothetical protein
VIRAVVAFWRKVRGRCAWGCGRPAVALVTWSDGPRHQITELLCRACWEAGAAEARAHALMSVPRPEEGVSIEFPMWAGLLLRARVRCGLARWSARTGHPVELEEGRTWRGSRFWVRVAAPAAAEPAVRAELSALDGPRYRQAWWAVRR